MLSQAAQLNRDCVLIHSLESFSTVDGPGIRSVVFFQGCPLKCPYCHNRDTWSMDSGTLMTVNEVMDFIGRYKSFYRASGGGVTFSGGEPLMQSGLLIELLRRCKEEGIHTALESSGYGLHKANHATAKEIISLCDLVILDVKKPAQTLSQSPLFIRELSSSDCQTWLRYVKLPKDFKKEAMLADEDFVVHLQSDKVHGMIEEFGKNFKGLTNIEALTYHTLGEHKQII